MDFIESNWLLVLIALIVAVAIAWYVFHASRRTRITAERRDVLDEGAAPAARNQALIDSTPAVHKEPAPVVPPAAPTGLAGAGVAVEAGALNESAMANDHASTDRKTSGAGDDLTRIKGVGPKLAELLHGLGINSFAEIAEWGEADIARIDPQLGRFQGRIERDNWVEQARYLAKDDVAGFESRFGKVN
ncbi:hypothetical protein GRI58_07595 [Porphyrobacter algicida]|uniref:Uncharacterized protein n=1 Tax=Qipengyuania algicida TaxID=1836209 RepID=A0A845ADX1_9SPHN|nr:helix-hairpin-helix domain-containing protein [Qipengyuania algicida]MXP28682.1 hypothetical protein [Qipengyuania algicida]